MSVEKVTTVRYKCKCDHEDCGYRWESDHIPTRCSSCKRYTWNRPAQRAGRIGKQITAFGKSKMLVEWAKEYKINPTTIAARLRYGWTIQEAIATPVHKKEEQVQ